MIMQSIKHECAMCWMKMCTRQCFGNRADAMHVFGRCRNFNDCFVVDFLHSSRSNCTVSGGRVQHGIVFARKLHRRYW